MRSLFEVVFLEPIAEYKSGQKYASMRFQERQNLTSKFR